MESGFLRYSSIPFSTREANKGGTLSLNMAHPNKQYTENYDFFEYASDLIWPIQHKWT